MSRFYISVNTRNYEKTYKALLHDLIDNPNMNLESIEGRVASLASRTENKKSRRFLLDCDVEQAEFDIILNYLNNMPNVEVFEHYQTPNGFGVITSGFDTRELLANHSDVTMHRDGHKFVIALTKATQEKEE